LSDATTANAPHIPLADRRRIDEACDRFEAACREAAERPDLADFLAGFGHPAVSRLLGELLAVELEIRRDVGETLDPEAYRARFPAHLDVINAAFGADGSTHSGGQAEFHLSSDAAGVEQALASAGYELLGELGRGGMGVVFRAKQVALGREVAVKVIRAGGFARPSDLRRFRNEAEAVARLDHPNIVPIYDVGRSQGRDYFSMKLIAGAGLDRRLSSFVGDLRESARLVSRTARAIAHAHERGVLHRDLKPANILVDAQGEPHVTDFGLARRLDAEGDLSLSGDVIGTPSYMSPEQAAGCSGTLTTAADIYGLGAVLHALLTGKAPHTGSTLVEILERVRDERAEPPSHLNPRVPRDLDVICLKCLEKDPKRRYTSASELADDLDRWLEGRPIAARPIDSPTRVLMWCRRHPLPAGLLALLLFSIVAGLGGTTWKWREAARNDRETNELVDYLSNILGHASTNVSPRAANLTLRELLDAVASRVGGDFQGRPRSEAAIREAVGGAYESLGQFGQAEEHLSKAVALDARLYGKSHRKTLGASNLLAIALAGAGRHSDAERLLRTTLGAAGAALGADDPETMNAAERLGVLLFDLERTREAEPLLRRTLDDRRRVLPPDDPATLRSMYQLCALLMRKKDLDEAESLAVEFERGIRCARDGPKHPDNVAALRNLGLIRRLRGKPTEAEPYYRRAADEARRILGPDHPTTRAAIDEFESLFPDPVAPPPEDIP
jgi:serine/threonine protein kinase